MFARLFSTRKRIKLMMKEVFYKIILKPREVSHIGDAGYSTITLTVTVRKISFNSSVFDLFRRNFVLYLTQNKTILIENEIKNISMFLFTVRNSSKEQRRIDGNLFI
jgi:hypothetical protein